MKVWSRVLGGLAMLMALGGPAAQAELVPVASGEKAGRGSRPEPPAWAKDAVWYQIFPERFRNGDPGNDPTVRDLAGAWPHDPVERWQPSPWTADWYELQPWEKANGKDFYYNAQLRRYGGDLQGVLESLDYLQSLGVNALYLNPVFESPSLHKYDAASYHHVDDNFGPDPAGDRALVAQEDPANPTTWRWTAADKLFLKLVAECHRRGMHVIVDGVFNHVGQTFWAFRRARAEGPKSKFAGWFSIKAFDDPATPEDEFAYEGWAGVPELPELKDQGDTLAAGPWEHIRSIVRRWGDPNGDGDPRDGVDGWRLDVADKVGHAFWQDFRRWVLETNPDAYLTGEVWWQDWPKNRMFDPGPWLQGDEFDAVMNYRWADAVRSFFLDRRKAISARELERRLARLAVDVRPETTLALQNLMDSHDTDRLASQAVNPDRLYDHAVSPKDDPSYEVRAPREPEWARVKLVAAFQFTAPGAPMVYYGTEAGMWGGDDPDERKPMVWRHLVFDPELSHPLGRPRPEDAVAFDEGLFRHYQKLARLRAQQPALRRGSMETLLADDARRLFAFARTDGASRVVCIFNASEETHEVELETGLRAPEDVLGGLKMEVEEGLARFSLPPLEAAVLVSRGKK